MIEFPSEPAPNGAEITPVDAGFTLRGAAVSALLRVNRAGTHYRAALTYPPMKPETADKFLVRLERAKREGLRIEFPLLGRNQGAPGSPVVDGSGQAGTTLALRGLTPGYAVKEGYKLTVVDGDDNRALHKAAGTVLVGEDGTAEVPIEPPLRLILVDGDTVLLAKPTIDGLPLEDVSQVLSLDRLVRFGGGIVIEETSGRAPTLVPTFDDTDTFTFDMDD